MHSLLEKLTTKWTAIFNIYFCFFFCNLNETKSAMKQKLFVTTNSVISFNKITSEDWESKRPTLQQIKMQTSCLMSHQSKHWPHTPNRQFLPSYHYPKRLKEKRTERSEEWKTDGCTQKKRWNCICTDEKLIDEQKKFCLQTKQFETEKGFTGDCVCGWQDVKTIIQGKSHPELKKHCRGERPI